MHTRPCVAFAQTACRFNAEITVEANGASIDGKSVLGLHALAAGNGTELQITAVGSEAEEAVEALRQLVGRHFDEE